jgi:hypothetical protein
MYVYSVYDATLPCLQCVCEIFRLDHDELMCSCWNCTCKYNTVYWKYWINICVFFLFWVPRQKKCCTLLKQAILFTLATVGTRVLAWQPPCRHSFIGNCLEDGNNHEIQISIVKKTWIYSSTPPVTVAEQSKACTVFASSEAGIVGSNTTKRHECLVWVCVHSVFMLSCV